MPIRSKTNRVPHPSEARVGLFNFCDPNRVPYPSEARAGLFLKSGTTPALRSLLLALIALLVVFGAHATDTTNGARYEKLSHAIMCPCGCNELLGECNHVGCPDSDKMRTQLASAIDRGDSNDGIFRFFQAEYGPTALAAPMFTGFNRFSWFVPPAVLLFGIAGVFLVVRRWRPRVAAMPAPAIDAHTLVLEQRIRRETGGDL